ncbi:MAG: alpha/beta hydrolase [Chloroflexi bacterium]|nr:alpha/beta hydrolase [Chloroflexota bacterium]
MKSLRSRAIYKLLRLIGSPFDENTPITQQRAYLERQSKFLRMPSKVEIQDIAIGDMYAEWVSPPMARNDRAILYLHGGGYTMGSCNTHRAMVARISVARQAPVLLIEYSLAPENPFPAALEDAIKAYHHLIDHGTDPRRTVIAGDSAGGSLVVALAVSLRDKSEQLPAGIFCISPWADLTISGESYSTCSKTDPMLSRETSLLHASWYVGENDPKSPLISPVFADLSEFPPMLIQVGEYEILRSDSVRLAEKARQAGVDATLEIWDGMWHLWHAFAGFMPESQRAIERIDSFANEILNQ